MMKRINYLLVVLFTIAIVSSCSDDNSGSGTPGETGTYTMNATSLDTWVYFSIANGDTVAVTDNGISATPASTDWDIAFHGKDVRVNCGASGTGQGGVLMTDKADLDAVTSVPDGNFVVDIAVTALDSVIGTGKMGAPYVSSSYNSELSKWMNFRLYDDAGNLLMPPGEKNYQMSDKVFIVRCANGRYAKLKFTDYSNDKEKTYYPSFTYVYPFSE